MSDLRKAAEQALEALDCLPWQASPIAVEATKALRTALAQGVVQEIKLYDDGLPPKREWSGLSVSKAEDLLAEFENDPFEMLFALDKYLREKNA